MAWNAANPVGSQPIRLGDDSIRDNNDALEDALGREHIFPGTMATTAGQHNIISMPVQSADPAVAVGKGQLYTKLISAAQQLFYQTPGGVAEQVTGLSSQYKTLKTIMTSWSPANYGNVGSSTRWASGGSLGYTKTHSIVGLTGEFTPALAIFIGGGCSCIGVQDLYHPTWHSQYCIYTTSEGVRSQAGYLGVYDTTLGIMGTCIDSYTYLHETNPEYEQYNSTVSCSYVWPIGYNQSVDTGFHAEIFILGFG